MSHLSLTRGTNSGPFSGAHLTLTVPVAPVAAVAAEPLGTSASSTAWMTNRADGRNALHHTAELDLRIAERRVDLGLDLLDKG